MLRKVMNQKGEFGIGAVMSIAVALIVAAFVLVPGMQTFAQSVLTSMNNWWSNFSGNLFLESSSALWQLGI